MCRLILFLMFTLALSMLAVAQPNLKGYLKDSITHQPLANGKLINATQRIRAMTDSLGFFTLKANPQDFIFASANGYRYHAINYSALFRDTITLYLSPEGNVLPTVTVTSRYTKYQLDSMLRLTEFDQMRGTTYTAVEKEHGPGFGLTINLDRFFKKKYRDKKEQEQLFNELEKNEYVRYRFSPELVGLYTGLKGEKLQAFIKKNDPGYEWLRQHPTNEDVLYYINDKLKKGR